MITLMFYDGTNKIAVSNLALFLINQKRKPLIIGKKDDFAHFLSFACTKLLVLAHENQIMHHLCRKNTQVFGGKPLLLFLEMKHV